MGYQLLSVKSVKRLFFAFCNWCCGGARRLLADLQPDATDQSSQRIGGLGI
jgi:hypothetical protein